MKVSMIKEGSGVLTPVNDLLEAHSTVLSDPSVLDELVAKIGESHYVLIGEASHGTHEYYTWRALLTQKLIREKGFSFVAVEGDWPDCYRLNRYVKGYADAGDNAWEVLHAFNRWPTWMWANWETVAFAEWLRRYNAGLQKGKEAGFYGLDVYSLWESLDAVLGYLEEKDPTAGYAARQAIRCFEPWREQEGQGYAQATLLVPQSCEEEVVDLLMKVRERMAAYNSDPEAVMSTEQNALVAVHAEQVYRAMVRPGPESWNIRDRHMVQTLNRLMDFHGPHARAVVWAHNSHIGDARATDMAAGGMVNIGQLVNEQHVHDGVYAVGFGSYKGTVMAGRAWGDILRVQQVPAAQPGSWEFILHQLGARDRIVYMDDAMKAALGDKELPHRAIGVVYRPHAEHLGNYVPSLLPHRYDAFLYLDTTSALMPVHLEPDSRQMPETFPFGL